MSSKSLDSTKMTSYHRSLIQYVAGIAWCDLYGTTINSYNIPCIKHICTYSIVPNNRAGLNYSSKSIIEQGEIFLPARFLFTAYVGANN